MSLGSGAAMRLGVGQPPSGSEALGDGLIRRLALEHALAAGVVGGVEAAEQLLEIPVLRNNAGQIINYGERHHSGERISTGFVESAVNQIVAKRLSRRQSMRWTQRGAHLALQARTRVLNGELEEAFRRRWPASRPLPEPTRAAGNCSFA